MTPLPGIATSTNVLNPKPARTIKLVVIGASGAGKTSLRGQYISNRFTTGYRSTIGTDFITKTLPWPSEALVESDADPNRLMEGSGSGKSVALQIWDTAGQERFSSLSSAFFRGADAVILLYDVNNKESLYALEKWWSEFSRNVPLPELELTDRDGSIRMSEEVQEFCVVFVGNKIDLIPEEVGRDEGGSSVGSIGGPHDNGGSSVGSIGSPHDNGVTDIRGVTKDEASKFVQTLFPPVDHNDNNQASEASSSESMPAPSISVSSADLAPTSVHSDSRASSSPSASQTSSTPAIHQSTRASLNIQHSSSPLFNPSLSKSLSRSSSRNRLQSQKLISRSRLSPNANSTSSSLSSSPYDHVRVRSNSNPNHPYSFKGTRNRAFHSHRYSASQSQFFGSTMASTRTTLSIYHTPSSSFSTSDDYQSARASPEPSDDADAVGNIGGIGLWKANGTRKTILSGLGIDTCGNGLGELSEEDLDTSDNLARRRSTSGSSLQVPSHEAHHGKNRPFLGIHPGGSASTGSIATITPISFAKQQEQERHLPSPERRIKASNGPSLPPPPLRGPAMFYTSAKTGEGVKEVFEYIAKRVVRKWEYDEAVEARRMHFGDWGDEDYRYSINAGSGNRGDDDRGYGSDGGGWAGIGRRFYRSPYGNGKGRSRGQKQNGMNGHVNGNGRAARRNEAVRVGELGGMMKVGGVGGCCAS